ncbi:MAG: cytochrome c [bacterium]
MTPRPLVFAFLILLALAPVPFVLIAQWRGSTSTKPPIHLIPDMDTQPKFKPQSRNLLFADHRAMRPSVPGTVAWDDLQTDDHLYTGKVNGEWATTFPFEVSDEVMNRGRQRYEIYCSVCHGLTGEGDGIVQKRVERLTDVTWVPPPSYHTDTIRDRPVGHLFNTITNGIRTMPPYGPLIPVRDRWAIVAYIRALQRSQNARMEDVPDDMKSSLR